LGFLIIGLIFMASLFSSVFKLIDFKWNKEGGNFGPLVKIFRIPLIAFVCFLIFVLVIVPMLEG